MWVDWVVVGPLSRARLCACVGSLMRCVSPPSLCLTQSIHPSPLPTNPPLNRDDGGGSILHACVSSALYPTHDDDDLAISGSGGGGGGGGGKKKRKKAAAPLPPPPGREPKSRKALAREAEERERREREREGARRAAAGRVEVAAFILRVDEQRCVRACVCMCVCFYLFGGRGEGGWREGLFTYNTRCLC